MTKEANDLFRAVEAGDLEGTKQALASDPSAVNRTNDDGATALHLAAIAGHREIVRLLVEHGGDLNARDAEFDATAAGWSIEYLREMGGLLATEIDDMLFAIRKGDAPWVRRFLSRSPAFRTYRDNAGRTFAEHATVSGQPAIAELLRGQ